MPNALDAQKGSELSSLKRWWPVLVPVVLLTVVSSAQPSSPLTALILPTLIAIGIALLLFVVLVIAVARRAGRARVLTVAGGLALSVVYVAFCLSAGGPLGVRFFIGRVALHEAAMSAVRGDAPSAPARIGGFAVSGIEVDGGIVRLETHRDEVGSEGIAFFPVALEQSEIDGYAYLPLWWYLGQWFIYSPSVGDGI